MCIFSNISTLNVSFDKNNNISPMSEPSRIGHIFRTGGDRCLLYMFNSRKTNTSTYIFLYFLNS